MSVIQILDDRLISQIAAGEVVERPASVVKELVENALDAGATEIRVELEAGGKRRIIVTDDGKGMGADDALLAFDRHATSKIATFDDLEQVATLGFRGEALATIAAVARVELRTAETPGDGQRVRIEGGRVKSVAPVSHPRGTRIEVASLFYNVPARRKFLKRPATELRHVLAVLQGYALAQPEVRFTVRHDGRTLLETLPEAADIDGLRARIAQVFGSVLAKNLLPIEAPADAAEWVRPGEAISGFVGNRETARGRRTFVFINRRLVRDRAVMSAFYRAVRETAKGDAFPALFLFLDVVPEAVDVNVHPQKSEVRFRDLGFVRRIEAALRATLEEGRGEEPAPLGIPKGLPAVPATWEGLGGREPRGGSEIREPGAAPWGGAGTAAGTGDAWTVTDGPEGDGASAPAAPGSPPSAGGGPALPDIARPSFVPQQPKRVPLSGRSGPARPFRLLGQYKGSLILLEGPDGLYLIDQHVAHERLLYEQMRRAFEEETITSQRLLEPLMLELGASEALRLQEMAPALESCGFELAVLSGGSVALVATPSGWDTEGAEAVLHKLATNETDAETDPAALRRQLLDDLAADSSCKAAVKMHHPLSVEAMETLVSELFRAEQPFACPHGRPIVLQMGDVELERRFGRR